jgi:hypothetical protein
MFHTITFHGPEATTEANKGKLEIWAAAANRKYFTGEEWTNSMRRTYAMDVKRSYFGPVCEQNFMYDEKAALNIFGAESISQYETRMAMNGAWTHNFTMRNICLTERGILGWYQKLLKLAI